VTSGRPEKTKLGGETLQNTTVAHNVSLGMPLQNRVDPFGNIFRASARGTTMGNRRGAMHNADREIVRRYRAGDGSGAFLNFGIGTV